MTRFNELLTKCDDTMRRTVKSRLYLPHRELTRDYTTFLTNRTKRRTQFMSFDLSANQRRDA